MHNPIRTEWAVRRALGVPRTSDGLAWDVENAATWSLQFVGQTEQEADEYLKAARDVLPEDLHVTLQKVKREISAWQLVEP